MRPKSETPRSSPLNSQQLMEKMKEFGNQTGALFGGKGEKKKGGSEIGYAVIIAVVIMLLRACVSYI